MADDTVERISEVAITYTVKELLARIEDRAAAAATLARETQIRLDAKVASLATTYEVEELRRIVERHEARWNRVLGAAVAAAVFAGGASGWVSSLLAGGP